MGIWLVVFGADCISTFFVYIDVVHGFLLFFCIIGQPLEIIEIKEVIYYRLRSPSDSNQHSLKSFDLKSQSYLRVFSNRHPFQILISMADLLDQVRVWEFDLRKWKTAIELRIWKKDIDLRYRYLWHRNRT